MVCTTCGEEYLNEEITDAVLNIAEKDVRMGVQVSNNCGDGLVFLQGK